jgi:hypothetical protein
MNGEIEIKSEYKRGSRFRIKIPFNVCSYDDVPKEQLDNRKIPGRRRSTLNVVETAATIRTKRNLIFKGPKSTLKGMHVIVVEDQKCQDDRKLESLYQLLERDTCEVTYTTFDQVISMLQPEDNPFDTLLMIASSPTQRTKQTLAQILRAIIDKRIKPIPFAILSGNKAFILTNCRFDNSD